ncbi:hypothetical protein PHMEG_00023099 [Phytophthora megakarya]|uniref:Uncharacterized protein n=1 Tax=Phytophthora megakarya TaxID=4795 RepID=A0A225VHN5_9STRA|nr:hypothetical protein PHMEG_00023099 [Phytophthora megakarya]
MQNDKFLMGEVRSSPVLGKLRSSLHKSPSKKLSVADVQNIGVATMKSMKSTEKWYHSPGYAVLVGVILVIMAVVGPALLVGSIAN